MHFDEAILREAVERINQLGLTACPVCGADKSLYADHRPVMLHYGGLPFDKNDPKHDPEANVDYMIRIYCHLCGYTLLFDSEKHHGEDVPSIHPGSQPLS